MAINTTRLAQKIGKILGGLNETNTFLGTTLAARVATIYAQYTTYGPGDVTGIFDAQTADQDVQSGWIGYFRSLISAAIVTEVQLDRLLPSPTLDYAVSEWVRQMTIAGDSFQNDPPTLTPADVGVPVGDHLLVATAIDGTNVASDLVVPDVYLVTLTLDSDNGGVKWAETFSVVGKAAVADPATFQYPTGSGVNTTVQSVDPAAGTTLTTDPSFADWAGNTPTNWTIESGVAGSTVFKVADDPRDGADGFALRLVGNGTDLLKIWQTVSVEPNTVYDIYFRVKKVADPGTDWAVRVRLVDSDTGTAVSNTTVTSPTAGSVASSWANVVRGSFATPAALPDNVSIEILFSGFASAATPAVSTAEAYVDWVNIQAVSYLYAEGPAALIYSGLVVGVAGDTRTLTATIATAPAASMIRGMDRLLSLANYPVRIPTAGSPTQSDALIS